MQYGKVNWLPFCEFNYRLMFVGRPIKKSIELTLQYLNSILSFGIMTNDGHIESLRTLNFVVINKSLLSNSACGISITAD